MSFSRIVYDKSNKYLLVIVHSKIQMKLTPNELKLTTVLLYVKNVEIRFAGGWVRDKLLGLSSHDIDVALEGMTGEEFVGKLQYELQEHHQENMISHIGKIAMNPDQSKHLETVTGKVCNFDCDFVNLRSESYANHSRIPEMALGSAKEDALRRDFTINSLFYNVNSQKLEDFTGHGLKDLENQIIRTPIDAKLTFQDDPLRAIRAVRFASKLKFKICPEVVAACQQQEIKEALHSKVSNERIVIELNKVLSSNHPDYGFYMLNKTHLFDAIFDNTFTVKIKKNAKKIPFTFEKNTANHIVSLSRLLNLQTSDSFLPIPLDPDQTRILYLSILYSTYSNSLSMLESWSYLSNYFTVTGLKFSKKDNSLAGENLYKSLQIKSCFFDNNHDLTKKQFGLFIKRHCTNSSIYPPLMLASLLYLKDHFTTTFDEEKLEFHDDFSPQGINHVTAVVNDVLGLISKYKFENIANWKPILDGNDIQKLKPVKGEAVGEAMKAVLEYQIEHHPVAIEQVKEWFKKQ